MSVDDAMIAYLKRFDEKPFLIKIQGKEILVGEGTPSFIIHFKEKIPLKELMTSTSLALGEAYMNGSIDIEGDLYPALNNFLGQMGKFDTDKKILKKIYSTSSSKKNQKQEVSSHYDIGNDFYKLWLDETLSYSCAYFKNDNDTLEEAQNHKIDRILQKLNLSPGMTLLDIGCGWGGLIIKAAKEYGVNAVGITLSIEQHKGCLDIIEKEGLEDKVSVDVLDYRDLVNTKRKFDRVVSVGMLEHVGRSNYGEFFKCVDSVMKPGSLFLLHFISALKEHDGDAFIKKYIFPGGVVPSLREIIYESAENNYYTLDVESLRRHYNKTLLCWSKNFNEHRAEIQEKMGERFTRMWYLYLCSCAATFNNGIIDLHQVLFSKGVNNELPMRRTI